MGWPSPPSPGPILPDAAGHKAAGSAFFAKLCVLRVLCSTSRCLSGNPFTIRTTWAPGLARSASRPRHQSEARSSASNTNHFRPFVIESLQNLQAGSRAKSTPLEPSQLTFSPKGHIWALEYSSRRALRLRRGYRPVPAVEGYFLQEDVEPAWNHGRFKALLRGPSAGPPGAQPRPPLAELCAWDCLARVGVRSWRCQRSARSCKARRRAWSSERLSLRPFQSFQHGVQHRI